MGPDAGVPSAALSTLRWWFLSGGCWWGGDAPRSNSRAAAEEDGGGAGLADAGLAGAAEVVGGGEGVDSSSDECTNSDDSGARLPGVVLGWLAFVDARRSSRTDGAGFLSWGLSFGWVVAKGDDADAGLEFSIFRFLLFMGRRISDVCAARPGPERCGAGELPASDDGCTGERPNGDWAVFTA